MSDKHKTCINSLLITAFHHQQLPIAVIGIGVFTVRQPISSQSPSPSRWRFPWRVEAWCQARNSNQQSWCVRGLIVGKTTRKCKYTLYIFIYVQKRVLRAYDAACRRRKSSFIVGNPAGGQKPSRKTQTSSQLHVHLIYVYTRDVDIEYTFGMSRPEFPRESPRLLSPWATVLMTLYLWKSSDNRTPRVTDFATRIRKYAYIMHTYIYIYMCVCCVYHV